MQLTKAAHTRFVEALAGRAHYPSFLEVAERRAQCGQGMQYWAKAKAYARKPHTCDLAIWCEGCARAKAARLANRLADALGRAPELDCFVTGTVPQLDEEPARVTVARAWDRWVRKLRRKGGAGCCLPWPLDRFVAVFEPGARASHIHVHALVRGIGSDWGWWRRLWGDAVYEVWPEGEAWTGGWLDDRWYGRHANAHWLAKKTYGLARTRARYLAKYLRKGYRQQEPEVAAVWYRRRRLTASRGLLQDVVSDWRRLDGPEALMAARLFEYPDVAEREGITLHDWTGGQTVLVADGQQAPLLAMESQGDE